MKKEDKQIEWKDNIGFYNGKELFSIWFAPSEQRIILCFLEVYRKTYTTVKSAKRGAERFLRRLQEAVKLDKKEPKTCDDCWLQRDFGYYIPAGYCADKCAKIYNALKD